MLDIGAIKEPAPEEAGDEAAAVGDDAAKKRDGGSGEDEAVVGIGEVFYVEADGGKIAETHEHP